MVRDKRYSLIKERFEEGKYQSFSEIFEILPKTVVAKDMKWHNDKISLAVNSPERCPVADLYELSKHLELDPAKVWEMVIRAYQGAEQEHVNKQAS